MISFGNDEIRNMQPLVGTHIVCERCGEAHEIVYGKTEVDGGWVENDGLAFVHCGDSVYLCGIKGKRVRFDAK